MPPLAIEIAPNDHFPTKVYTTLSVVEGRVLIRPQRDVRFGSLRVALVGSAEKRLELGQLGHASPKERPFLMLEMPTNDCDLSNSTLLKSDRTYSVPFYFRIPRQLPLGTCGQSHIDGALQHPHLRLPPTLGAENRDDMCPNIMKVQYYVAAEVTCQAPSLSKDIVVKERLEIDVLPVYPEEPALPAEMADSTPSAQLLLKQNALGRATGMVYAMAYQPRAVMFSPAGGEAWGSSVQIVLRFVPSATCSSPPSVKSVTGTVISNTYFGSRIHERLSQDAHHKEPTLNFKVRTPACKYRMGELKWNESDLCELGSRNEAEMSKRDSVSEVEPCYVAKTDIPFSAPRHAKRRFLPTFHFCLFSRTYTFELKICFRSALRSIKLLVPLQIGVQEPDAPLITGPSGDNTSFDTSEPSANLLNETDSLPPDYQQCRRII